MDSFHLINSYKLRQEMIIIITILFANMGRKTSTSGDERESAFLFYRVSALVQRYNAVLLHDTLPATDCTD